MSQIRVKGTAVPTIKYKLNNSKSSSAESTKSTTVEQIKLSLEY